MIVAVLKRQRPAPKIRSTELVYEDDAFVLDEVIVELDKFA